MFLKNKILAGSVSRIWSRPDQSSSQIISVGPNILDPEQAALFALETDGSLIVLSASEGLAGSYQCRIATQVWSLVTSELSIMTTLILAGKQRGDPQGEDCPGHNGEPGAVQWIIFPLQSAQLCCSLCCILFMLYLLDQPTKHAKTIFFNNPTFLE